MVKYSPISLPLLSLFFLTQGTSFQDMRPSSFFFNVYPPTPHPSYFLSVEPGAGAGGAPRGVNYCEGPLGVGERELAGMDGRSGVRPANDNARYTPRETRVCLIIVCFESLFSLFISIRHGIG